MSSRLEQLQQMLLQEPHDEFLQYAIAIEYFSGGQNEKAIEMLEKMLHNNPGYLAAYYQLGKCYEVVNKMKEAATIYTKGIELAQKQGKQKTLSELREALFLIDED
jgi:predicted Zn-dependent protease